MTSMWLYTWGEEENAYVLCETFCDILRFCIPSPGPKMKLPFAFRPPHLQERWDENYQDMGGQEEK